MLKRKLEEIAVEVEAQVASEKVSGQSDDSISRALLRAGLDQSSIVMKVNRKVRSWMLTVLLGSYIRSLSFLMI